MQHFLMRQVQDQLSIAHSAVKTKYAASEGLVALLEPFIDTVVICTLTALVIIIFNGDNTVFQYGGEGGIVTIAGQQVEGAGITAAAFSKYISFSGPFLTIAVVLFAISNYDFLVLLRFAVVDVCLR